MTVVRRLRRDAALRTLPGPRPPGRRGPERLDGERRIALAKRAGQRRGWITGTFDLSGKPTAKRSTTVVATWRPAGGVIRVARVDEPTGWVAFVGTDPTATVADLPGRVADRLALETAFRDCTAVVGAGQPQVRFVWASVGACHLGRWTVTLTEAWAWGRSAERWVDRAASPWDDPTRRPRHADQRRAWRRELPAEEIRAVLGPGVTERGIQAATERRLNWAA